MESFDRSTSREYENLNNDLTQKYKSLTANKEKTIKDDDEKYKSILKQVRKDGITGIRGACDEVFFGRKV